MVARQRAGGDGVLEVDREPRDPAGVEHLQQILRCLQLPQRALDRDLPRAGGADEHLGLVGDQVPGLLRQRWIVGEPPQQDVGVEQQPHDPSPRNAAARSTSRDRWVLASWMLNWKSDSAVAIRFPWADD